MPQTNNLKDFNILRLSIPVNIFGSLVITVEKSEGENMLLLIFACGTEFSLEFDFKIKFETNKK